ncbi:MAG: phosphoglycerate kinase [Deltaproteobacteria bacterium]|nr:phosphoglycerate kinase [Deltaproteobacteria bacterium]
MAKLSIEDIEVKGKRVLMRVDFNVPLEHGKVADDNRIRAALPTMEYILDKEGRLIIMSHLGRPKGKRIPELSLKPCVPVLGQLLGKEVLFVEDCIGARVEAAVNKLNDGDVLLLENLRFYKEETNNDPDFAERLARLGEIYVNDAFGTAHRAHASTVGVTRFIKQCAAGFLMNKELKYLGKALENPQRPFVAILGGAKISGKIDVISNLLPKVDKIIIGGGMAYTFFKATGKEIGKSLLEEDKIDFAEKLLKKGGDKLVLPVDCMVSEIFNFADRQAGELKAVSIDAIAPSAFGLDIGPRSIELFESIIREAKTIFWNGPMGVFEIEATAKGTYRIAKALADATSAGAVTVIGGGDSALAVNKAGVAAYVSHVSTGGGASPGVAALTDK